MSMQPAPSYDELLAANQRLTAELTEQQRSIESLRQKEDHLRLALAAGNIATWEFDLMTQYVIRSANADAFFGLAAPPPVPHIRAYRDCLHVDDRAGFDAFILELHQCSTAAPYEARVPLAGGGVRWLSFRGELTRDAAGAPKRMRGVILDITARKTADEARRLAEARMRRIFDANLVGVMFNDQVTGKVLQANNEFLRIIGASREDLVAGRINWRELTPPEFRRGGPKGPFVTGDNILRAFRKEYIRRDGAHIPVLVGAAPVEGDLATSVALVLDLTGLAAAEQALAASEERFRQLFDRNPAGVFAVDTTGRFTEANPACVTISGYSVEELMTRAFTDLCAPDRVEETRQVFVASLAQANLTPNFRTALIRKDGSRVELLISGGPVRVEGRIVSCIYTATDITAFVAAARPGRS